MKRLAGILVLMLFTALAAFSQKAEKPLVQFSGIVHNADSMKVIVPYVTITNVSYGNQINLSNYKGYFSFVAHEQDTLRFTCVGYEQQTVVIPAGTGKSYILQISLKPQTIHLPMVRVFPWATTDEFRKDFLTMKIADDDLENARKNLSKSAISASQNVLARDAQEIQSFNAQQMHYNLMNSHSLTPNPLLNPIAWGSLIKQIADGDKSRSSN
ncbi:carboxypeptidase-like regulatory domain-containing protein [Mucilaginibacter sp. RS28]|uniref:Carboxypeptidase-like regulatory domain-containing protein n=1 Tax=Mucilaginibacter straminoryzae TaxID=2932774 RepID=A0A9X2BD55_9SPHI|nr:carboxypeptidase-like regulatory domain-containing protein [Mucilaginibacter straminoryzae]MCJ8211727.1 carboxypeptidase-like regulatory domain-containing protein [Mucilaginibacter straminoryzae]